ncbi:MAG: penicillin-binding protein 2 [Gaiellaceae bacterium]
MPEIPGYGSFIPGDPRTREPWHINSQTVLRTGILGAIAVALFAFLAIRLWALQIISGNEYLRIAQDNQVRTVRLQAPRGSILARDGRVLVKNRLSQSVLVWYAELPREGDRPTRYDVLSNLARVLGMPPRKLFREVEQRKTDPMRAVVAEQDVNRWQSDYILERADQFPGVEIAPRYVRTYPHSSLASLSQILGYVGSATEQQIKSDKTGQIRLNDVVGQSGAELAFDSYLRGQPGLASQRIDSLGRPRSELIPNPEPQPGDTVRLTIDADLQWRAQKALQDGIQTARNSLCDGCWNANGGAIVALDANNGAVLAMATYPTYPPSVYSGRVTTSKLARWGLTAATMESKNYPAINRATSGLYPPGSIFKPVTAIAAMQAGVLDPSQNLPCTGKMRVKGHTWLNWDPNANSMINLPTALAISCDTYFYQLGLWIWGLPPTSGEPIQDWAKTYFDLGKHTGIEIGDLAGVVPTKAWQRKYYTAPEDRTWKPGDSLNLAIGQKDLQVTPLQMARLYAAIATGKIVYPHLLYSIERDKRVVDAGVSRTPTTINPGAVFNQNLNQVRSGLELATHDPLGTSYSVFNNFPVPIAGKTGTAEKWSEQYKRYFDQSWWCGYGPYNSKPEIVVCAVIENGGHGGTAAAPAAREVFQAYFHVKNSSYQAATHTD